MVITHRDERIEAADTKAIGTHGMTATDPVGEERDENGMTSDDVFDQLADDDRVVTSGRGSRLPTHGESDGSSATGYSAGIGSGVGTDD